MDHTVFTVASHPFIVPHGVIFLPYVVLPRQPPHTPQHVQHANGRPVQPSGPLAMPLSTLCPARTTHEATALHPAKATPTSPRSHLVALHLLAAEVQRAVAVVHAHLGVGLRDGGLIHGS